MLRALWDGELGDDLGFIVRSRLHHRDARMSTADRAISALTKIAAECHRTKWQFDLSEDYQPSKSAARALIAKAFDELHRIGDETMKLRDQIKSSVSSS